LDPITRASDARDRGDYVEISAGSDADASQKRTVDTNGNGQEVTLNFVNVPIQDFVRAFFDEALKEPVVVDSSLKGTVTVRTQGPVSTEVAIELVRQALLANGATLVKSAGAYRISTRTDAKAGRRSGDSVRVTPLKFISAEEAKNALSAFGQSGVDISSGPNGRFLVLSGTSLDLDNIEQALESLDVDQMKGMSFGLFPLREANASIVANEMAQVFGRPGNPRAFRALPIDRMNAVLVVSTQEGLLTRAKKWLERLDRADRDGRKIYVYPVQNRRAPEIAKIISAVLDGEAKNNPNETTARSVAPQLTPVSSAPSHSQPQTAPDPAGATADYTSSVAKPTNGRDEKAAGPRISADVATNSIVVTANVDEWKVIESALRRLDIMAPQVLIEATIAEVTLNDALSHGVQWYFSQGNHTSLFSSNSASDVGFSNGFNYAFGIPKARVVLNALEQVTDVAIISSPALTVLDNQTAKLQVGDQVPITTQSAVSVVAANAPVVSNVEYKDTGVILSVTPRVNASGLVVLDISQEVSEVVPTTSSSLNSPTIRQRRVNSSIAVYSGMDIVLGGLISANKNKSDSGIPGIMDVPVVGNLFKSDSKRDGSRSELLVLLRPTVMANRADIRNVTDEIKSKMSGMAHSFRR
jgi:general secretion pathway protein D